MNVSMDFAIVVGSSLIRSGDIDPRDPDIRDTLASPPFDGAWIVNIDDEEILDENLWDLLDVVLHDLVKTMHKLDSGPARRSIVFPDTSASVRLERREDGTMTLTFDDTETTCAYADFRAAAADLTGRVAQLAEDALGQLTGTYRSLARFGQSKGQDV